MKFLDELSEELFPIDIGKWLNYNSFADKEQIALQRKNFISLSLYVKKDVNINFIFTKYIAYLNNYITGLINKIKLVDTDIAIQDEVYHTCKIEGCTTTRIRTSEIHNGSPIDENDSFNEYMIANGFKATKFLNVHANKLTQDILIDTWKILTDDARDNEELGVNGYRSGDVRIGSYIPVSYKEVECLMNDWFNFYNSTELENYPLIKSILLHFAFELIHPFCDGNGRTGRMLMTNYLISRGFESCKALSFSMKIDERRAAYDAAFCDSENIYFDATPFIEYMLQVMAEAVTDVYNKQTIV